MRELSVNTVRDAVRKLLIDASYRLPPSLEEALSAARTTEPDPLAVTVLSKLEENLAAASEMNVPICQDTGMAVVYLDVGQEVRFTHGDLMSAVQAGVADAYTEGYLRKSVVRDPLFDRVNTGDNTPAVVYTKIVPGEKVTVTVCPKGFGSENMSKLRMFTPSAKPEDIVDFVTETVKTAGGNPCPPVVVGVGLGGTFDYAAFLAKKALARDVSIRNPDQRYAALEQTMLEHINATGVGPQGFGGRTTALAVNIETYPTHIAGLPCAVNIGCHVTRHKTAAV